MTLFHEFLKLMSSELRVHIDPSARVLSRLFYVLERRLERLEARLERLEAGAAKGSDGNG